MKHGCLFICLSTLLLIAPIEAMATDYNVGPGRPISTLAGVPWSSLAAGDTVYIHYATYHEKFNLSTRGTAAKPIRVIGVPDSAGNRPVIDGDNATTPASSDFKWQDPALIQENGVVFVTPNENNTLPAYIEIKNLEIKNAYVTSSFTAENGTKRSYIGFSAGIYIKSAQNVLIENCVIHDNGQAIFNWSGSGNSWHDGLTRNLTIRGNHFYNNGHTRSWTEHQTYTEGENVTIEYNYYGAQRPKAKGSHLKDRSAGTVIRYNYFDSAPNGWIIDLVEPENSWCATGYGHSLWNHCATDPTNPKYLQAFVYGNVFVNRENVNYFHWNEDHQGGSGRAVPGAGRLFFYNNTVLTVANKSDVAELYLFNTTEGGYECAPGNLPGIIDIRNNIFAMLPRTSGSATPVQNIAYCKNTNLNFGANWISPGWKTNSTATVTGLNEVITGSSNDPGFKDPANNNLRLTATSEGLDKGGPSAAEMTNNVLTMDLTPVAQYVVHQLTEVRAGLTDLGAYED